jgi:hypothetical protein
MLQCFGSLLDIFQTKKSGLSHSNHNFVDAVGNLLLIAKLIDNVHFYEEKFVEYVPTCLGLLIQFMQSAQEFDSKVWLVNPGITCRLT